MIDTGRERSGRVERPRGSLTMQNEPVTTGRKNATAAVRSQQSQNDENARRRVFR